MTWENRPPAQYASVSRLNAVPPLCDTSATDPASMAGMVCSVVANVAYERFVNEARPSVLGPASAMPAVSAIADSRFWRDRPSGPTSAKPPPNTTAARAPRSAACSSASTAAWAGMQMMNSSTPAGSESMSG
jgi:hypothetical protein